MRVVHMIPHLRLGAGRYVTDTAIEQHCRLGHGTEVWLSRDAEGVWKSDPALVLELRQQNIGVRCVGDFFERDLRGLQDTAGNVRGMMARQSAGPDLVHAHTAMAAAVARWAGTAAVVCTCHGWSPDRPAAFELQDGLAYRLCDRVTSPSRHWARQLAGMMVPDVDVVPVGLDLRQYPELERASQSEGPLRLISLGELSHRKGSDVLLEAMPLVWERYPEVTLDLMGRGDLEESLKRRVALFSRGTENIRFLGHVSRPYPALGGYDLLCLASRSDNLPVAIIEAMLAGLPIVATSVGGIPELIQDGDCGVLVTPESPGQLAAAVIQLVERGESYQRQLGAQGQQFARQTFAIESTVNQLDGVYRQARLRRASAA